MSTISASTTTTTAYKVTADTTGTLVLQTGATPTTAVTIDTSQNVGINTSTPGNYGANITGLTTNAVNTSFNDLYIGGTRTATYFATSGYSAFGTITSTPMTFYTNNTERMRIDSSGNLLVGTSSASTPSTTGFISTANTFGFKNRIINGAMGIWQRSTSYSGTPNPSAYGSADRWAFYSGSPITASQSTSVPSGFQYSLKLQRPNAATTTVNLYALQVIESNNMIDLQGQSVTLSFWAKAGANFSASSSALNFAVNTGTVADQGSASAIGGWTGNAYPIITTATLTTTWTRYTATGTVASNALEMGVLFWFTPTGTAGADDSVYITGVQLEKGSTATSFDYRPYGTELALCQRYFVELFGKTNGYQPLGIGNTYSTTQGSYLIYLPVPMRTSSPSLTTAGNIYFQNLGNINISSFAGPYSQSATIVEGDFTMTSAVTTNTTSFMRFNNVSTSTSKFNFSAEL